MLNCVLIFIQLAILSICTFLEAKLPESGHMNAGTPWARKSMKRCQQNCVCCPTDQILLAVPWAGAVLSSHRYTQGELLNNILDQQD